MRRITLDIETTSAAHGFDFSSMELSVIGIHESDTDTLSCYTLPELPKLWPILEAADVLVGYNSDHFDIPILNRYYAGDLTKIRSVDLLSAIRDSLGRRLKLDSVAEATLGRKKTADGLAAVKWWAAGEYEKVKKYCMEDVRITKDVYEYALKNSHLLYMDFGEKKKIPIDTSSWETGPTASLTHTLPF